MLFRELLSGYVRREIQSNVSGAVSSFLSNANEAGEHSSTDWPKIAITFAMGIEAGGTCDALTDSRGFSGKHCRGRVGLLGEHRVLIAETGVGAERAALAVREIIAIASPAYIISAGFAGGLSPVLRRRDLLAIREVKTCDANMPPLPLTFWGEFPLLLPATLVSASSLVRTTAEKKSLAERTQALACDMESYSLATECQKAGIPMLDVRVVSDALNDELPLEVESLLKQDSIAGKIGAVLGGLFRRPGLAKDLWQLNEEALQSSDRLAIALKEIVACAPSVAGRNDDHPSATKT